MSEFFKWFDAVNAKAAESPVGQKMLAAGFEVSHNGGGTLSWHSREIINGWFITICDEENGLGNTLDEQYMVGLYHEDGDFIDAEEMMSLDAAISWGEEQFERKRVLKELADCDGAVLYWQVADPAYKRALEAGVIRQEGELLVHPDAIELTAGECYIMPEQSNG